MDEGMILNQMKQGPHTFSPRHESRNKSVVDRVLVSADFIPTLIVRVVSVNFTRSPERRSGIRRSYQEESAESDSDNPDMAALPTFPGLDCRLPDPLLFPDACPPIYPWDERT